MPTIKYAENTEVPVSKTQMEIHELLKKFNVQKFLLLGDTSIIFEIHGKSVQLEIHPPSIHDPKIQKTPTGIQRKADAIQRKYEQAIRQQWRILLFLIKAALVSIENELMTIEEFFLPYFLLGDGKTVKEHILPQLETGSFPLLPGKHKEGDV